MAKLYIHIGTHKTATTTIQKTLLKNKKVLNKNKLIFIRRSNFIEDDLFKIPKKQPHVIKRMRDTIKKKVSQNPDCDFVVSCEGLSGKIGLGYSNSNIIAESLSEICKDLIDVKIIVFLRRQDDFIESVYTQMIHSGESCSFNEFLNSYDENSFNWNLLLTNYAKFFGNNNLLIRRYHKAFLQKEDSILDEFWSIIGADNSTRLHLENKRTNSGYSRDALEIARSCNPYLNLEEKIKLRKVLQNTSSKKPFEKYSFFTPAERKEFLSKYSDSNQSVAKKYLPNVDNQLFPPINDSELKRSEYKGLSTATATAHLSKALLSLHQDSITISLLIKMEKRILSLLSLLPGGKRFCNYLSKKLL